MGWGDSAGTGLQGYWLNDTRQIVIREYQNGAWGTQLDTVAGPLVDYAQFCTAQFDAGAHIRVYYQTARSSILQEVRNDGSGWVSGTTIMT